MADYGPTRRTCEFCGETSEGGGWSCCPNARKKKEDWEADNREREAARLREFMDMPFDELLLQVRKGMVSAYVGRWDYATQAFLKRTEGLEVEVAAKLRSIKEERP